MRRVPYQFPLHVGYAGPDTVNVQILIGLVVFERWSFGLGETWFSQPPIIGHFNDLLIAHMLSSARHLTLEGITQGSHLH